LLTVAQRLWSRVDRSGGVDACWPFLGARNTQGYGHISVGGRPCNGGQTLTASVLAWIVTFGEPPLDLDILHSCDNPPCCNPKHLFLGNDLSNSLDRFSKSRGMRVSHEVRKKILGECLLGIVQAEIAQKYSVSQQTVSYIFRSLGGTSGKAVSSISNRLQSRETPS